MHGVEQPGEAGVQEGGVADDGEGALLALPPARVNPCSMGMLAPISTAECMWLTGGRLVRS